MNLLYNYNSGNPSQPSFIEMFLETQMIPSLKPALEWVIGILAQRYNRLYSALDYLDEIFYGVVFILERHYLKHYDGSFSENFYGLKRVIVTPDGKTPPALRRLHKLWSLFFLVVVPYLKTKLDKYYQKTFGSERPREPTTEPNQAQKFFGHIYPFLTVVYEGLFFLYQILYMYDMTQYYTPLLHLQGLVVKKISLDDMVYPSILPHILTPSGSPKLQIRSKTKRTTTRSTTIRNPISHMELRRGSLQQIPRLLSIFTPHSHLLLQIPRMVDKRTSLQTIHLHLTPKTRTP
jgi:hypothetical protein